MGCALCFFFGSALPRSKLRQAGAEEETAFVPQACLTARKTLKTCWRKVDFCSDVYIFSRSRGDNRATEFY